MSSRRRRTARWSSLPPFRLTRLLAPGPRHAAYAASKAALRGFCKSSYEALRERGVRVMNVAAGNVAGTAMAESTDKQGGRAGGWMGGWASCCLSVGARWRARARRHAAPPQLCLSRSRGPGLGGARGRGRGLPAGLQAERQCSARGDLPQGAEALVCMSAGAPPHPSCLVLAPESALVKGRAAPSCLVLALASALVKGRAATAPSKDTRSGAWAATGASCAKNCTSTVRGSKWSDE